MVLEPEDLILELLWMLRVRFRYPGGSGYTANTELEPNNNDVYGVLGPNSILALWVLGFWAGTFWVGFLLG